ncbi:MAG: SRPBCC domain-containing protein [bacterium]|nr:SRPBCC domain-containing protein [bacterium]
MQKAHYSILINAPRVRVWQKLFDDASYRIWTEPFASGCHFQGSWNKGSKILFLAPGEDGKLGGMVSRIAENKPNEFMSIEHLGIVAEGVEDTTSEAAKKWAPSFENYTLKDRDGATELLIEMDIEDSYAEFFDEMWPKALQKLKEISEAK